MKLTAKKLIKMLSQPYAASELEKLHMRRTVTSTVMEGIALLETVALWAVIARLAITSDSSHTQALILIGVFGTAITALLLYGAYHPIDTVNLPFRIKTVRQVELAALSERTTALLAPPMAAAVAANECGLASKMPINIMGAVLLCTGLVFIILIWRAKYEKRDLLFIFSKQGLFTLKTSLVYVQKKASLRCKQAFFFYRGNRNQEKGIA